MVIHKVYNEQGQVEFKSDLGRARDITYKGNNKTGDWTMEVYLETNAENDIELSPDEIKALARNDELANQTYSKPTSNSNQSPLSGEKVSGSQVKAMLKHTVSDGAFSSAPVNKETAEFAKILDDDGLGGDINAFTSFTGGKSHKGGYESHYSGYKFDVDLKSGDSVQAYARAIQRVEALAERHGYDVVVFAEKRGWSPATGYHFRGGGGSHLDILVRGKK